MPSIRKLQNTDQLPATGVVFWWSNILRSYQMSVYTPQGEVTELRELHVTREAIELAAQKRATAMNFALFEIQIQQLELHALNIEGPPKKP